MNGAEITIIDYGMGNIGCIANALLLLGARPAIASSPGELGRGGALILPGVGAFGAAMDNLRRRGFIAPLEDLVLGQGKPLFGICLGMQLLALDSTEMGFSQGLGWLPAHVREMPETQGARLPHVGWNTLLPGADQGLFGRMGPDAHFYFDHSFHIECPDEFVVARCAYGIPFVAAVRRGNILATQFHPEKSQRSGLMLLRVFLNQIREREGAMAC